jgi:hypothetical protein
MNIKSIVFKTKYTAGIYTGLFLIAIPALLYVFPLVLSFLTDIKHQESPLYDLGLVLVVSAIMSAVPLVVLGSVIILISVVGSAVHTARYNSKRNSPWYKVKIIGGVFALFIILAMLYVPKGPDECSRHFTDSQYESCLEDVFNNQTQAETITWLESNGYVVLGNGYRIGDKFYTEQMMKDSEDCTYAYIVTAYSREATYYTEKELLVFLEKNQPLKDNIVYCAEDAEAINITANTIENYSFNARRDYGRFKSVPYGINFTRLVLPMFPAPSTFKLDINGTRSKTYDVKVDWSFSFL